MMMKKVMVICFLLFLFAGILGACGEKTNGLYGTRYTREELEKMNVNTEHLFIIDENKMTYNGKEFYPGMTMDEIVSLFGPYSRKIKSRSLDGDYMAYIWDDMGVRMSAYLWENTSIERMCKIEIRWNLDMSGDSYPTRDPDLLELRSVMLENNPKNYFREKIILGGAPIGRGMDYRTDFQDKTNIRLNRRRGDAIASRQLLFRSYDYSKVKYIKESEVFSYAIRLSEDYKDIESFSVSCHMRY